MSFVALSNLYMLLDLSLQVNCRWALQLQIDTKFKICDTDLNKLTLGLNALGAHYHPQSVLCESTLKIPAPSEVQEWQPRPRNAMRGP